MGIAFPSRGGYVSGTFGHANFHGFGEDSVLVSGSYSVSINDTTLSLLVCEYCGSFSKETEDYKCPFCGGQLSGYEGIK